LKRVEAVSGEKARVRRVCAKGVGSAMVVVVVVVVVGDVAAGGLGLSLS
jgi:hypothetical protein